MVSSPLSINLRSSTPAKCILIINDIKDIREIIKLSLELYTNWSVLTACSEAESLNLIDDAQPDVILIDAQHSSFDGLKFVNKLQKNPITPQICTVMMTERVRLSDRQRFSQQGINTVIAKPFDPLILTQQILNLFGNI